MKIHIIGCSGSGKTYLANALSKKYNISHFDLDDIQWDNNAKEYGKKRTLDERKALLQEILYNNDEWIVEGVYYAWVQQSFDEADKIYVLDMPSYLYTTLQLFHKKNIVQDFLMYNEFEKNITKESDPVRQNHYTTKKH